MSSNAVVSELKLGLTVHNFIGGRYSDPHKGVYYQCSTESAAKDSWLVPRSCAHDVERALEAANLVLPVWSEFSRERRVAMLANTADHLMVNRELLERSELWDFATLSHTFAARAVASAIQALKSPRDLVLAVPQANRSLHPLSALPSAVTKQLFSGDSALMPVARRIAPLLATGRPLVVGVLHKPNAPSSGRIMRLLGLVAEQLPPGVLNVLGGTATRMGSALIHSKQAETTPLIPMCGCNDAGEPTTGKPRLVLH